MTTPAPPGATPPGSGLRLRVPEPDAEPWRPIADRARALYGTVPETLRVMAVGTATAEVYLTLAEASETSTLSPLEREYIAVQTARSNGCRYCFTAHLVRALLLGADPDDLNGLGTRSLGSRIDAILSFAAVVLATRGAVADDLIAATHAAGIDDRGLVDIVTVVTENVLGNSINNLAGTPPEPGLQRLLARRGITAAIAELPTT